MEFMWLMLAPATLSQPLDYTLRTSLRRTITLKVRIENAGLHSIEAL